MILSISAIIISLYIYTHIPYLSIHLCIFHIYLSAPHKHMHTYTHIYMTTFFKSSYSNETLVKIHSYLSGGAKLTQLPR